MKTSTTLLILLFTAITTIAQPITGQWSGTLNAGAMKLKVVFHITKSDSGYTSNMDSPDQGAKGIRVTKTSFNGSTLKLDIASLRIEYNGVLMNDTLTGTFTQAGNAIPLVLTESSQQAAGT